ncbi:MAG TPA: hypothetical protein VN623_01990 [Hyphomicrobium sp.]|jgi:chemotaxis protein MotC|uniref:hypothetical protein n=1 Tax=Hyphomicrobium sp. TaxID=82 RepID=UPI002B6AE554|nr:hypothetical protein [Hyphomicrobium sp.]HXE00700.1 hypothetical protein [Hyphomicrobium sp.]
MKRIGLIASAFLLFAGVVAGAFYYLMPKLTLAETLPELHPGHAIASYAGQSEADAQSRKRTLDLVEALGGVQDRIIGGDREAIADQSRLLSEIAGVIRYFEKKDWDDYVKLRASFVYVLSGGDPEVLKPYVNGSTPNEADRKLAHGIMSFAQGQTKVARKLFQDIDPRSLDVSLVGPFALARASLYLDKDGSKAIYLLDEARLASPNTAIEEAAARREIPLLVSSGDAIRGMMLAADYVHRFGKSIYARKLFRDLSQAVAQRDDMDDAAVITGLMGAIEGTDQQVRAKLLLNMSAEALLHGRLVLAKTAAGEVLKMGNGSAEDQEKARLYQAAAEAPSSRATDALKVLDEIAADQLSDQDTEIRAVAGYIARVVVGGEPANVAQADPAAAQMPLGKTTAEEPKVASALESADAILKQAETLIQGKVK